MEFEIKNACDIMYILIFNIQQMIKIKKSKTNVTSKIKKQIF